MPERKDHDMIEQLNITATTYSEAVRSFWLKEFPVMALLFLVVSAGMAWGAAQWLRTGAFDLDWHLMASINAVVLLILPIWMFYPEQPTEASVEHDRILNEIARTASRQRV